MYLPSLLHTERLSTVSQTGVGGGVTNRRDSRPPAFQRCQQPGPAPDTAAQLPCSWYALLALPEGSRRLYVVPGEVRGGRADSARGELGEPGQGGDPLRALPAGSGWVPIYIEILF